VKGFEDIFDSAFNRADGRRAGRSGRGKLPWKQAVGEFYDRFVKDLADAREDMQSYKIGIPTDELCPKCEKGHLLERISRNGFFMGCDRYPDCDYTRDLSPELPTDGENPVGVPGMRQGNGDQARKVRNFPGVQRLPGMQNDSETCARTRKGETAG